MSYLQKEAALLFKGVKDLKFAWRNGCARL
jgi:hypothetical protein